MVRIELDGDRHARPIADLRCLDCGHCVAVCPSGAVSDGHDQAKALPADWRLDADRVSDLLKGRRSIRAFRSEPLPQATIAAMIDVARYAPSGHNSQPLAWTVLSDRGEIRRIAEATVSWMRGIVAAGSPLAAALDMKRIVALWDRGIDCICRDAPHLIVAHAPAGLPSGAHTAAIAMTYLDVAGQPLGVGACWAGFVFVGAGISPELHAALGLPAGQQCAGIMMAGRPAVSYRRIPARNQPHIDWR